MAWMILLAMLGIFQLVLSIPAVPTTDVPLSDHIKDIVSIIPKEAIRTITYEHLKSDEGFKTAVKFMQTDEWNDRVKIIREKPEWIALKKYMINFGINLNTFIKCVEGFMKNVTVTLNTENPSRKSVKAFLLDVEQNLPTMQLLTAVHEKLLKDVNLQQMFDKISSTDTRKMIDNVLALPEVKGMLKDFADMDMNIMDVIALLYSFLGWGELKLD